MKYSIDEVASDQFFSVVSDFTQNNDPKLMAMFGADETELGGGLAIYCVFHVANTVHNRLHVIKAVFANGEDTYRSITPKVPAANWYEREINDMFGLKALGHPDLRPLVLHERYPEDIYPLRKSFAVDSVVAMADRKYKYPQVAGPDVFEVPVGPIHAGIIEPGHFVFSQAGETVLNLEAKLFFTHRGVEKAVEGLPLYKALFLAERICGACCVSHALSFCQAVESLSTVPVSNAAKLVRTLVSELERLYNHVGDFGNISAGLAFAPVISNGARMKEQLMRINERLTGNRWLRGMIVPGGVKKYITKQQLLPVLEELMDMEHQIKEIAVSMYEQHEFVNRVSQTGILPTDIAKKLCCSGVAARATGLHTDTRREFPYALYDKLEFDVVTEKSGDVDARLKVRIAEISESVRIIKQLAEQMDKYLDERICVDLGKIKSNKLSIGMSESARGNNLFALIVDDKQCVQRLFVRSASYSNWPALPVAVPGNIIPDFPLINKSFELCYACLDK